MTEPAEDGTPAVEAVSFVGRVISGRYKVLALIGEGGMGAVYLAEHVHMRKRVAIKVLHPDMVGRPEVVARFEREAMAAAHIDHPNVAAATDFGRTDDGAFFLVLEYIEGTDLRTALRQGPMDVARGLHIARQIAFAMVRAHELGIVHRDLKPENVMLVDRGDEGEFVKVLDFGIAKVHIESLASVHADPGAAPGPILTRAGAVFGTPEYMAPEQALGDAVDHRADLYALGVMLFEMLSGKLPFEGSDTLSLLARQIAENAPMLRATAPDRPIPAELEALVMRLLAKQPRERYASADELLVAIDGILHLTPPPQRAAHAPTAYLDAGSSRVLPPSASREIFTPADAMARTSPELFSTASPIAPQRVPVIAAAPPNRRHMWVAVVVALCGGALLVGAFTLVTLFRHVKASVLGGNTDGGVLSAFGAVEAPKVLAQEELDVTATKGAEALEKLATEYPNDARVLRALFRGYFMRGDTPEAIRTVGRLATLDPSAANDPDLIAAVTVAATDPSPEARDAAITVLEGPLGAKGADVLYELANRTPAAPGKARFAASLNKSEVLAHASPALNVLMDFRAAKKCEDKRDLLPQVREHGDARLLSQLKTLQRARGCGFLGTRDCWPCLHKDGDLDLTLSAVQSRL